MTTSLFDHFLWNGNTSNSKGFLSVIRLSKLVSRNKLTATLKEHDSTTYDRILMISEVLNKKKENTIEDMFVAHFSYATKAINKNQGVSKVRKKKLTK